MTIENEIATNSVIARLAAVACASPPAPARAADAEVKIDNFTFNPQSSR